MYTLVKNVHYIYAPTQLSVQYLYTIYMEYHIICHQGHIMCLSQPVYALKPQRNTW